MENKFRANKDKQKTSGLAVPIVLFSAGFILILIFAIMMLAGKNKMIVDQDEIPRISAEDAMTAYKNGDAVFLDVRTADAFAQSHVPGAINIPVAELETRINELDPHLWIITYCT